MKKILTALLAAGMLLTGCGGKGGYTVDAKFNTEVFNDFIVMGQDIATWNYLNQGASVNTRVLVNVMSGLVDTDKYGQIVGDLAESWEHNDDNTVWTFHLRDGINWFDKDGNVVAPIVAQDWVTSVEWVLNPKNASECSEMAYNTLKGARPYLDGETTDFTTVGVKALDDKTVEFTMENGVPYFDSVCLYSSFYPVNADFIAEKGESFGNSPENILYSGAYTISSYTNDTEKTFVANPGYWDYENITAKTVNVFAIKDTETSKQYFENGELSYCTLAGTQPIAAQQNDNPYFFRTEPAACAYVMFMNNLCADEGTNKAWNNENFRKAFFYGFDFTPYVEQTDPLDPESLLTHTYTSSNTFFTSDGTDYVNLPALKEWNKPQYDAAKGQEYMEKAKAELEAEGVTFPIEIPYYYKAGNETAANTAEILKQCVEETFPDICSVAIHTYTTSARTEVYAEQNHGWAGAGWIPDYRDPVNVLYTFLPNGYMNNSVVPEKLGISHWNLPEFIALFEKADAEVKDIDLRYNLFAEAEAYLLEHAYVLPLYQAGSNYQMVAFNKYSRPYSKTGGTEYRYKGVELFDHALTAEEVEEQRAAWQAERVARGLAQ